jgi:hypothetical protein
MIIPDTGHIMEMCDIVFKEDWACSSAFDLTVLDEHYESDDAKEDKPSVSINSSNDESDDEPSASPSLVSSQVHLTDTVDSPVLATKSIHLSDFKLDWEDDNHNPDLQFSSMLPFQEQLSCLFNTSPSNSTPSSPCSSSGPSLPVLD